MKILIFVKFYKSVLGLEDTRSGVFVFSDLVSILAFLFI